MAHEHEGITGSGAAGDAVAVATALSPRSSRRVPPYLSMYYKGRMRTLYHYRHSPFSRRTRLALAHKGLACELREAREQPAHLEEARGLVAFRTMPVLVDHGRAMGDSTAIVHWLDLAYPVAPRLWPQNEDAADVLQVAALVDVVLNGVVDVGTRYNALHGDAAWNTVTTEILGRSARAAQHLAARVGELGRPTIARVGWSAADMWLLTMTIWFETLPSRAATNQHVAQLVGLGFELPAALCRWTDAHRGRDDVRALDA
jgi:glutathione S-transferase